MIWFCGSYVNIRNKTMYRICGKSKNKGKGKGKSKNKYIEQVFFDSHGNPISIDKSEIINAHATSPNLTYTNNRGREVLRHFIIGENDTVFEYINNCDWLDEITDKNIINEILKCKDIM